MNDFCNTQNIMQMDVPVLSVHRYGLEDADRLFFSFDECDKTQLGETTAMLSGTKETRPSVTPPFILIIYRT